MLNVCIHTGTQWHQEEQRRVLSFKHGGIQSSYWSEPSLCSSCYWVTVFVHTMSILNSLTFLHSPASLLFFWPRFYPSQLSRKELWSVRFNLSRSETRKNCPLSFYHRYNPYKPLSGLSKILRLLLHPVNEQKVNMQQRENWPFCINEPITLIMNPPAQSCALRGPSPFYIIVITSLGLN